MRTIIAANWKMHKNRAEARETARDLAARLRGEAPSRAVVLFPPFTALEAAQEGLRHGDPAHAVGVGGQNVYPADNGAFTGEICPAMLLDAGCSWVLTGHSERRHIFGETSSLVGRKTAFALSKGLCVIFCIGETLAEREGGRLEAVLREQLSEGLRDVAKSDLSRLAVAYEPVWAIGTGKVASEEDILNAHAFVRQELITAHGMESGEIISILYGGSVKPDNAGAILSLDNVNGLLVGGASLQAESFVNIIRAGQKA